MSDRVAGGGAPCPAVAVIGGGSIGVSFALVFARAGCDVRVFEPSARRRAAIAGELEAKLAPLESAGLLEEAPRRIVARVRSCDDLVDAVRGAGLVQECAPERLADKQEIFAALAEATEDDCVLASSSSAITASESSATTSAPDRCLVAHPGNPPHLIPVIELAPSPHTRADIVRRALAVYRAVGLSPVVLRREVEGFLFNRLQGAVLREAYALVRDGVADVDDIDTVVRDGLGRRWAFMGPFETVDLNTRGGLASHAEKMGPAYHRMGLERGQDDPWTDDVVAEATRQRRAVLTLERWEERVAWRDQRLIDDMAARTERERRRTAGAHERRSTHDTTK